MGYISFPFPHETRNRGYNTHYLFPNPQYLIPSPKGTFYG